MAHNWKAKMTGLGRWRIGCTVSQSWHPVLRIFTTRDEAEEWLRERQRMEMTT